MSFTKRHTPRGGIEDGLKGPDDRPKRAKVVVMPAGDMQLNEACLSFLQGTGRMQLWFLPPGWQDAKGQPVEAQPYAPA